MNKRMRRILIGSAALTFLAAALYLPGLPWSARNRHKLGRALTKAQMKLARWRGNEPKLAVLSGSLMGRIARLEVLNSVSGWAALTDRHGRFSIPDVIWYPGVSYDLIITADVYNVRRLKVTAPSELPEDCVMNVGEISFDSCEEIDGADLFGLSSVSYQDYDKTNRAYYQQLFARLTAGKRSDEERLEAINEYISTRRVVGNRKWTFDSPRQVIEEGSEYCGNLAMAMAAVVEAAHYKTRRIDISDRLTRRKTHVLIEVYYANKWHMYDPTFGVAFRNNSGDVASYKEIRLDNSLVSKNVFRSLEPKVVEWLWDWMPEVYSSGFHHLYYFRTKPVACPFL